MANMANESRCPFCGFPNGQQEDVPLCPIPALERQLESLAARAGELVGEVRETCQLAAALGARVEVRKLYGA
jgi:hypothetical protein